MKTYNPHHWPFERGIHRCPVDSPHKGHWSRALMFSLMCTNGWTNSRVAGDPCDISVMSIYPLATAVYHELSIMPPAVWLSNWDVYVIDRLVSGGWCTSRVFYPRVLHHCHCSVYSEWGLLKYATQLGVLFINSSLRSTAYICQWIRSAVVHIMACRLFGAKPLSQPILGYCKLEP